MNPLRARFQRWPRPWRIVVLVLAGAYLAYLLAGNIFLNTPLFDRVTDRRPAKFRMQTGPALTLIPGHVIAWNVTMRGQARQTAYLLRADRASGQIALLPLFARKVVIRHIEATGVEADVDQVATLLPSPPASDRGWTLRFDTIHSGSIRRARFGKVSVRGDGRGSVGFSKQLKGGPSQLFPSEVAFEHATVGYDGLALVEQATLVADVAYPEHYRAQAPGLRKLGIVDGRLRLSGRTLALRIDTGHGHTALSTVPAQARVEMDVGLADGALTPGSRALWRVPLLAGVGATDRGMLALQLDVAQDIRLQARLPRDPDTGSELHADLRVAGRTLPWDDPQQLLPRTSGQLRGRWQFQSLNWISDLFVRKPWFRLDGGGLVEADLQLVGGEFATGSRFDVPQADAIAEVLGSRVTGAAQAHGVVVDVGGARRAQLDVAMQRFEVAPVDAPAQPFVRGRSLELQMHGDSRLQKLRDTLQARLRFRDAQVPDVRAYNRYLPQRNVRLLAGAGSLDGDVTLDASGEVGRGAARLRGRDVRLALAGVQMRGDADLQAKVSRADLQRRIFELDGSQLQLQKMQLEGGDGARDWWATLDVGRGRIDAGKPFQLDADAAIRMRDASLLLDLFARRADYPQWIFKLVDAGPVDARGRVRWRRDGLLLDDMEAHNTRLQMRARMRIDDDHHQGDLYLRWGVLGAAIELRDDQRSWHLKGARAWYDAQPALLR
jgi:hypothetical protein